MQIGPRDWPVLVVAVVALALAAAGFLRPQHVQLVNSPDAEHTLTVTGQGRLEVKPDEAVIVFGVTAKASTAQEAQQQAATTSDAVIVALKQQGIAADQMRTVSMYLNPEYNYRSDGPPKLTGYVMNVGIQVKSKDLDGFGPLIDTAVAAGANEVRNIQFNLKDETKYKQQAIDKAVADARSKANATAAKLGTQVQGVKAVQVIEAGMPSPTVNIGLAMDQAVRSEMSAGAIMPGTQDFSVYVSVTFVVQ